MELETKFFKIYLEYFSISLLLVILIASECIFDFSLYDFKNGDTSGRYSEPVQTSKMKPFSKIVNGYEPSFWMFEWVLNGPLYLTHLRTMTFTTQIKKVI